MKSDLLNSLIIQFTKSYISRTSLVAIISFFGFLYQFIIIYSLDLESYGNITRLIVLTYLITIFGELGINVYANDLIDPKKNFQSNNFKISRLIILKFANTIFITFVASLLIFKNYSNEAMSYFIINNLFLSLNLIWLFQVYHLQKKLSIPLLVGKIITFLLIFFNFENEPNYVEQLLRFILIGNIFFIIYSYIILYKSNFNLRFISIFNLINDYKKAFKYFLINFNQNYNHIFWSLSVILIAGNSFMAIFNICDLVIRIIASFTNFIPEILHNLKRKFRDIKFMIMYIYIALFFFIFSFACLIFINILFNEYIDESYKKALDYIPIAILISYVATINKLMVVPIVLKKYSLTFCFRLNIFITLIYITTVCFYHILLSDTITVKSLLLTMLLLSFGILIFLLYIIFIYPKKSMVKNLNR